jgi:hypothetical protein
MASMRVGTSALRASMAAPSTMRQALRAYSSKSTVRRVHLSYLPLHPARHTDSPV